MPDRPADLTAGMPVVAWCSGCIGLYECGWAMNAYDGVGKRSPAGDGSARQPVPLAQARARNEAGAADSDEALRELIDRVRRLCEEQPEPFRSLAFTTVL